MARKALILENEKVLRKCVGCLLERGFEVSARNGLRLLRAGDGRAR